MLAYDLLCSLIIFIVTNLTYYWKTPHLFVNFTKKKTVIWNDRKKWYDEEQRCTHNLITLLGYHSFKWPPTVRNRLYEGDLGPNGDLCLPCRGVGSCQRISRTDSFFLSGSWVPFCLCQRLVSCGGSVSAVPGWWGHWCCWPWPITSSDTNPAEHLWDVMYRNVWKFIALNTFYTLYIFIVFIWNTCLT